MYLELPSLLWASFSTDPVELIVENHPVNNWLSATLIPVISFGTGFKGSYLIE